MRETAIIITFGLFCLGAGYAAGDEYMRVQMIHEPLHCSFQIMRTLAVRNHQVLAAARAGDANPAAALADIRSVAGKPVECDH